MVSGTFSQLDFNMKPNTNRNNNNNCNNDNPQNTMISHTIGQYNRRHMHPSFHHQQHHSDVNINKSGYGGDGGDNGHETR